MKHAPVLICASVVNSKLFDAETKFDAAAVGLVLRAPLASEALATREDLSGDAAVLK